MRIRIKFSKTGQLKYIGHLDVMRFFQKAIRRAGIDVAYSEGFSPHMLMSFAQPLGVGVTSEAEYFDLDLKSAMSSSKMKELLNEQMPEGISIFEIVKIPEDKANKCMTLVAAADYEISLKDQAKNICDFKDEFSSFMQNEEINIIKKTKRSEALTDIRPLIYEFGFGEEYIRLRLSSGSVNNLKPQLVMNAFFDSISLNPEDFALAIHRKELLAESDGRYVPLYKLGEEIL